MNKTRQILKRYYFRQIAACFLVMCMLLNAPVAFALSDADVASTINANVIGDGIVTVDVLDSKAVVNWTDLDTIDGEILEFIKSDGGFFAVLNRVVDNPDPTLFNGALIGNQGHIIIVNPNGIVFGGTAYVEAAKFTASALNLDPDYFMNPVNTDNLLFIGGEGAVSTELGAEIQAQQVALLGKEVRNAGTIISPGGFVLMATGETIYLGTEGSDVIVEVDLQQAVTEPSDFKGDVINEGVIDVSPTADTNGDGGDIVLAAGDTFALVVGNKYAETVQGNVYQKGSLIADGSGEGYDAGNIEMSAVEDVYVYENSITSTNSVEGQGGEIRIYAGAEVKIKEDLASGGEMTIIAGHSVNAGTSTNNVNLTSGGGMDICSGQFGINLYGNATSEDFMTLDAGNSINVFGDLTSGKNMYILTSSGDTYSEGNLVSKGGNITLDTNLWLGGGDWALDEEHDPAVWVWEGDQKIDAESGTVTAEGWITKDTSGELYIHGGKGTNTNGDVIDSVDLKYDGDDSLDYHPTVATRGNLYIEGEGNVQISGDLTAMGDDYYLPKSPGEYDTDYPADNGGVSVISHLGKIYTDGATPDNDTLAIDIEGYSDDVTDGEPIGVDLPYTDGEGNPLGKAAIVIQSADTLKISGNSSLDAYGNYLPADSDGENYYELSGVDDRPGVDFLDEEANIGGYDRNPGVPFDAAIYLGSTKGHVELNPESLHIENHFEGTSATVVIDAYDTVKFTDFSPIQIVVQALDVRDYRSNFRLEVCSRITEWLNEAIAGNKLPFADNPELMEAWLGNDYVLRGSGDFDNPANNELIDYNERAWVLEEMPARDFAAAPLPVFELPAVKGCPVEMEAVALELGITEETIQIYMSRALAMNADIQPCNACARLIEAAQILQDIDGSGFAALNQVFNELSPVNAPYTPEMSAMVASALTQHAGDGTYYAQALEYINAFVTYIGILDSELGSPVGDSVAFIMAKHGGSATGSENPNVAEYLTGQLEMISGPAL